MASGRISSSSGNPNYSKNLANLLTQIGVEGRDALYSGQVAKAIEKEVERMGGVMTAEDLASYEPVVGPPIKIDYRDYEIATAATPSGGITILEIMKILEGFDLSSLGHNSDEYLHILIEASRHAFADRFSLLGDWEHADIQITELLSNSYASYLRGLISKNASFPKVGKEPWVRYLGSPIHEPWIQCKKARVEATDYQEPTHGETSHFNVVDGDGNAISCTHTPGFQAGVVPEGTGLYLTAAMGWFVPVPGYPNSVGPWKRPMMNMGPLIVLKDETPLISEGSPGSRRIIDRNLQVILNMIEFDMGPQDAIASPTLDASGNDTLVDSRMPSEIVKGLIERGHNVKVVEESPGLSHFARPSAIRINNGKLRGGVDLFRRSTVLGF